MSTPLSPSGLSPSQLQAYLLQIGHTLHALPPGQPAPEKPSAQLQAVEQLNTRLSEENRRIAQQARVPYTLPANWIIQGDQGLLNRRRINLAVRKKLTELEAERTPYGTVLKRWILDQHQAALEAEANLKVEDRLLLPSDRDLVINIPASPQIRPGIYALSFTYRERSIEFAGAFVLTTLRTTVTQLTGDTDVGNVLLFTPSRGLEAFASLKLLDSALRERVEHPAWRQELLQHLPRRDQHLRAGGIWPLQLKAIDALPLAEHTYNALQAKQSLDIDFALGLNDHPAPQSVAQLTADMDQAVCCTLWNLDARLELRAQQLLDKLLHAAAPDWLRRSTPAQHQTLVEHVQVYEQAREDLLALIGPAASPEHLARVQLLERLDQELDIQTLIPEQLLISTERPLRSGSSYPQQHSLAELAVRGLHVGDTQPGSVFLKDTRLTYAGQPLPVEFSAVTPAYLAQLLDGLQPLFDFATEQNRIIGSTVIKRAMQTMLDRRLHALAYSALLQHHITAVDYQLFETFRQGPTAAVKASCVKLHEAPLKDLWVMRQHDAKGGLTRLLLCTPQAPRAQQFLAFDSERALQAHVLAWSEDVPSPAQPVTMKTYLLDQLVSRIRPTYNTLLSTLGFRPDAGEHKLVILSGPSSYPDCLLEMSENLLAMQVDEYLHRTPDWLSRAAKHDRQMLADLSEDAAGAARVYRASPGSPAQFADFDSYLHAAAHKALNTLLGNPKPAVDPNQVQVITPREHVSYTTLYRNGYDYSLGFLNPAADTMAQFKGPPGVDLSRLNADHVSKSIRGTWIGERYIAEVEKALLAPQDPHYPWRRNMALDVIQLNMKKTAWESCLQGHIAKVDLAWLSKSIDSLGDSSLATRALYQVYPLQLCGQIIDGCYRFHHLDDVPLLYTPQAPDGIDFRTQKEFNERLKNVEGMASYYKKRVASLERVAFEAALNDLLRGLPEQRRGVYSKPVFDVPRPFEPLRDLRFYFYDKPLRHVIDDVRSTTTSRLEMIMDLVVLIAELTIAVVTAPFPVLSLALGTLLVFKDSMLALHAYHRGDTQAALGHYVSALLNAGGAVLTDLRPALLSAGKLASKPLRPVARLPRETQVMALVEQLPPHTSPMHGLRPVPFGGDTLWAAHTPDSLGRFLLFRYDAVQDRMLSTGKLVNKTADGHWLRAGVSGGAPKYEKLDTPYELSEDFRRKVADVLAPEDRSAMFLHAKNVDDYMDANMIWGMRRDLHDALQAHLKQVRRLTTDAERFFGQLAPLVKRAETLDLAEDILPADLLRRLLDDAQSLVIGESTFSIASKQLLIDHMAVLKDLNVKVIYIEHLWRDVHHLQTHSRFATGISRQAEKRLKSIDFAHLRAPEGQYGYWRLLEAATEHGIEIRPLNASSCYDLENVLGLIDSRPAATRPNALMNYYSHTVLNAAIEKAPAERWIALVDQKRMSTYRGTPGLADLQKTIALRVDDAFGQPTRVVADVAGSIPSDPLAKGDLRLSLRTSVQAMAPEAPPSPRAGPALESSHFNRFDLPDEHLSLYGQEITLPLGSKQAMFNTAYPELAKVRRTAQNTFDATRKKLRADAQQFFRDQTPPARVALPEVSEGMDEKVFIDQVLESADGLVVGEAHGSTSSKAFLGEHMEHVTGQRNVKTLYLEQLTTELHQADLDIAYSTGILTDELRAYLRALDIGHRVPPASPHTFSNLVQAAIKYKVRIRALDCIASLRVDGMRADRTSMFSYFATQVIKADQLRAGPHKWLALVGETHLNTYHGVPGIADLNKGISLLLTDVPPGSGKGFALEPASVAALPPEQQWPLVRYDFRKNVEVAGLRPAPASGPQQRLRRPGDYLIHGTTDDTTEIVHMDRNRVLVHTPVRRDANGYFVNRWNFDDQRFPNQEHLLTFIQHHKQMRKID
ncbi:membrane-targeted effector domain-containing toxin [uncultured Pseudomonas sp.]|uniref:membrane-targeted effector domain-containing toxin n=1 Tax=uncultured Pseudomonas sp. TaxID=114707 RepID=UPI0025F15C09|nr:membrane-targeted effector domain-containing toxin [uncultured Pseudomonas sp.]